MTNPVLAMLNGGNRQNGSGNIFQLIAQMRQSGNPLQAIQAMSMSNPQVRHAVDYVNQNGGDPRTAFYRLAEQKGVNPNDILAMLK